MKLSVVVPVYNVERFLKDCLDSFVRQTLKNFELILVDDGSTDKSGSICDEYASKYDFIKVFHQKNAGVSVARNFGLSVASGNYVSFVDSDDWVNSDYCEIIDGLINGNVDLIFFQACHVFDDNSTCTMIPNFGFYADQNAIETQISYLMKNHFDYEFFGYTWNKVFKKDLIKETFIRGFSFREDEMFTLSYLKNIKSLLVVKDVLYNYRIVPSGLTGREKTAEDYRFLVEKESPFLDIYGKIIGAVLQEKNILYCFEAAMKSGLLNSFFYDIRRARELANSYDYYKPTGIKYLILKHSPFVSYPVFMSYFIYKLIKRYI